MQEHPDNSTGGFALTREDVSNYVVIASMHCPDKALEINAIYSDRTNTNEAAIRQLSDMVFRSLDSRYDSLPASRQERIARYTSRILSIRDDIMGLLCDNRYGRYFYHSAKAKLKNN